MLLTVARWARSSLSHGMKECCCQVGGVRYQGSRSETYGMGQVFLIWENPRVPRVQQAPDQWEEPKWLWAAFLALLAIRDLQHDSSKSLVDLDIFAICILNNLFGINMLSYSFVYNALFFGKQLFLCWLGRETQEKYRVGFCANLSKQNVCRSGLAKPGFSLIETHSK